MLRPHNISVDVKPSTAADALQSGLERLLAGRRAEQGTTVVAAECYEVSLAGLLKSL